MNKKEICVVIPIYKETLNSFEIQSVTQCVQILSDYTIHFVCPKGLDIDFYKVNFQEIVNFTYFDKLFFEDLSGYNRLMLSVGFYKAFDKYQYMLVYQTDCYVFRDELMDWANRGYDYIGGVWFDKFVGNPNLCAELWFAGNGGFSLRNIKSTIMLLKSRKPIMNLQQLIQEKKKLYKKGKIYFLKGLILLPFNVFGFQNNYSFKAKRFILNEDLFFVDSFSKRKDFLIPDINDSLGFSWDRCPNFLFKKTGQLPFGCHAWYREDFPYEGNKEFWSQHINY